MLRGAQSGFPRLVERARTTGPYGLAAVGAVSLLVAHEGELISHCPSDSSSRARSRASARSSARIVFISAARCSSSSDGTSSARRRRFSSTHPGRAGIYGGLPPPAQLLGASHQGIWMGARLRPGVGVILAVAHDPADPSPGSARRKRCCALNPALPITPPAVAPRGCSPGSTSKTAKSAGSPRMRHRRPAAGRGRRQFALRAGNSSILLGRAL